MIFGYDGTNILGHGGIKTYSRDLLRGLAREFPDHEFRILTTFSGSKRRKLQSIYGSFKNVSVLNAVPHMGMLGDSLIMLTRVAAAVLWTRACRRIDLVHITDPFGALHLPRRFVATVHDIFPLTMGILSGRDASVYRRRAASVLERAGAVITPSDYVRGTLRKEFPNIQVPVTPIPEAASADFHPRENRPDVLNRYGLRHGEYFLFVGRIDPRKNIDVLMEARRRLPQTIRQSFPLAFVHSGRPPDIREFQEGGSTENCNVTMLRDVPQEDLYLLYSSALAFVFPTLEEGFGLPVLEAMQSGCPVITSGRSCLPEVTGDAALLVDPLSPEQVAGAMVKLASNRDFAKELKRRGLARASRFSWSRAAVETMDLYMKVLEVNGSS